MGGSGRGAGRDAKRSPKPVARKPGWALGEGGLCPGPSGVLRLQTAWTKAERAVKKPSRSRVIIPCGQCHSGGALRRTYAPQRHAQCTMQGRRQCSAVQCRCSERSPTVQQESRPAGDAGPGSSAGVARCRGPARCAAASRRPERPGRDSRTGAARLLRHPLALRHDLDLGQGWTGHGRGLDLASISPRGTPRGGARGIPRGPLATGPGTFSNVRLDQAAIGGLG